LQVKKSRPITSKLNKNKLYDNINQKGCQTPENIEIVYENSLNLHNNSNANVNIAEKRLHFYDSKIPNNNDNHNLNKTKHLRPKSSSNDFRNSIDYLISNQQNKKKER